MRATAVRRTALAACAVSLTLLVTACGGSSDAEDGKNDKGGAANGADSAPKTSAKALSAAELETASLKQGDVEGHKIAKTGPDDEMPEGGVTVDKEACLPVAHAMYGVAQKGSAATAKRKVVSEPKKADAKKSVEDLTDGDAEDVLKAAFDVTSTFIALHAYEGTAGPDTFAALKKAAGSARAASPPRSPVNRRRSSRSPRRRSPAATSPQRGRSPPWATATTRSRPSWWRSARRAPWRRSTRSTWQRWGPQREVPRADGGRGGAGEEARLMNVPLPGGSGFRAGVRAVRR
ncbi:hypothetical protein Smic_43980 [Streptomyces microflavus]|uniref:Lipoprotein n=1 Tax=Streptomyces microflavus TaxID=1919 RepID=A0A7J0CTU4_STRMI|nr:hypothetical protein Smic_43980 [Streptomyces microflavus]